MKYKSITLEDIQAFEHMLEQNRVFADDETRKAYGHDETEDLVHPPEVVLKPLNVSEVSAILKYCNEHIIPVTAIGGRTGLSGGALSVYG